MSLTALPPLPYPYDPLAESGALGASKLYNALLPTLSAAQIELAGAVLDELHERERVQRGHDATARGFDGAAYERQQRTIGHLQTH